MTKRLLRFFLAAIAVWAVLVRTSEGLGKKTIGDILRENGYREDFAGAAYMNNFAIAFRIVNNIVCGRCNVTTKEEECLPKVQSTKNGHFKLTRSGESCDREDAYYYSNIERKLGKFLPCLLRSSDEITMQCLMETPMGAPKPPGGTYGGQIRTEGDAESEMRSRLTDNKIQGPSREAGKQNHTVPEKRKEEVDIVAHAKITRVIIGENSGDPEGSPLWRRALMTSQISSHLLNPRESETAKFAV